MLPFIFLASAALSTAYFVAPSIFAKPLPIWALSLTAWKGGDDFSQHIAIGLLFSSAGDMLLELDHDYPGKYFIFGLLSFLVAHLLYIKAFWSSKLSYKLAGVVLVPVLVYYVSIMYVLVPSMEKDMVGPVLIYGVAISSMIYFAILRFLSYRTCGKFSRLCSLIGSVMFVASDSILAVNKFAFPIPDAHFYVMVTYYVGQTFIAASTQPPPVAMSSPEPTTETKIAAVEFLLGSFYRYSAEEMRQRAIVEYAEVNPSVYSYASFSAGRLEKQLDFLQLPPSE
jgi:alkenylglycerophosphocholine/alkenylglycerophosphoethanolamine hydrolase